MALLSQDLILRREAGTEGQEKTLENLLLARWYQEEMRRQTLSPQAYYNWLQDFLFITKDEKTVIRHVREHIPIQTHTEWLQEFRKETAKMEKLGAHFAAIGSADYPQAFENLPYSPFLLSYLGSPAWNDKPCLAVVGSREPSRESLIWMEENLPPFLQATEAILVSGAARGVDQKAHEISIRMQRPTIAILPSGLGKIYPAHFRSWKDLITQSGGALVSEYAYGEDMQKHFFSARNRLISGMSVITLIVQAGRRSGTLLTARNAIDQGRPVLSIPSHPMQIGHAGSLDLIMEGATPVRDWQDLRMLFEAEIKSPSLTQVQ